MKFAVVLVAFVALAVSATAVKNIGNLQEFVYENCAPGEAITINYLTVEPDPILLPGPVYFNFSVTTSVEISSPTPATFVLSYRADASSDWVDFHCVDGPLCGKPDNCALLDEWFPVDQPCPQSFIDNNFPCHCPFEAGTYVITNGVIQLTKSLADYGLIDGDYKLKVALTKDDVEIQCYTFQATLVDAAPV